MKRKLLHSLLVVTAAFAVFVFVCPNDALGQEAGYSQSESLRETSAEKLPNQWNHEAIDTSLVDVSDHRTSAAHPQEKTPSPMMESLTTCVLLC